MISLLKMICIHVFVFCNFLFSGGCSEINKPAEFLECNPPCTIDNSYCNDTDYCVCIDTYDPVFDRLNALVECVMDNSSAVPVSPKTVSLPGEKLLLKVYRYTFKGDRLEMKIQLFPSI